LKESTVHRGSLITLLITLILLAGVRAEAQHGMGGIPESVPQQLAASVHRNLGCASCHGMEHAAPGSAEGSCQGCHQQAAADFWRDRRHREPVPAAEHGPEYLRFTVNERVQHWIAAASFVTLVLTGFALHFGWRLPWGWPGRRSR
jgi:hypothetical protein